MSRSIWRAESFTAAADGIARQRREVLAIGYYTRDRDLVAIRHHAGGPASVDATLRQMVQDLLDLGAAMVALAHNHPDGDPTPSILDVQVTRRCAAMLREVDAKLLDHWIVTRSLWVSLRRGGWL